MEQFDIFWNFIHSMYFIGERQDKLCWKSTKNKGFKVSEFYLSLFSTPDNLFPWKLVWRSNIPLKVAFFSWIAALGKILTLIDCGIRVYPSWIGVICVKEVGSR